MIYTARGRYQVLLYIQRKIILIKKCFIHQKRLRAASVYSHCTWQPPEPVSPPLGTRQWDLQHLRCWTGCLPHEPTQRQGTQPPAAPVTGAAGHPAPAPAMLAALLQTLEAPAQQLIFPATTRPENPSCSWLLPPHSLNDFSEPKMLRCHPHTTAASQLGNPDLAEGVGGSTATIQALAISLGPQRYSVMLFSR